jgi:hypothetical protein
MLERALLSASARSEDTIYGNTVVSRSQTSQGNDGAWGLEPPSLLPATSWCPHSSVYTYTPSAQSPSYFCALFWTHLFHFCIGTRKVWFLRDFPVLAPYQPTKSWSYQPH